MALMQRIVTVVALTTVSSGVVMTSDGSAQNRETVSIRAQLQSLHLYGTRGGTPVIQQRSS
jgi:hypothetical protein